MGSHTLNRKLQELNDLHGGVDEQLELDNGIKADTIAELTSGAGVTIDGVTLKDGGVSGVAAVVDAAAATTLTIAQSGSLVILNSSDVVTLPAAATATGVFYDFLALTVATQGPRIDPNASEVLQLQASDLTGGNYAEAAAIGDSLRLYCNGTKWFTVFSQGSWTYEGA